MKKLEEAKLINERTNDLRNNANYMTDKEKISYDEAWNKAENLKGVNDVLNITKVNYGIPTYEYKEALMNIGAAINGVDVATISPNKLESLITANNMGIKIDNYSKEMTLEDIKKETINMKYVKEKTKEKNKTFVLEKPKDVNIV